ncbi:hypothetical protein [Streptomyces xanthophaeus]|uniref:hypothetical protein n=1 Tax=Streptomyces xanthophaeus TaxID=67385 RepID=UPI00371D1453
MAAQVIDLAIVTFTFTAAWVLRQLTRARPGDQRHWKRTTAARTEADVRAELAAAKEEARQLIEEMAVDIAFARIVDAEFPATPHDIPQQTRRTEEDQ